MQRRSLVPSSETGSRREGKDADKLAGGKGEHRKLSKFLSDGFCLLC